MLRKEINRLLSTIELLKLLLKKSDVLKTLILKVKKVRLQVNFWGAPTHAGVTEFSNFLLQLKNQRSGSKSVCGFSIIIILTGIMTF